MLAYKVVRRENGKLVSALPSSIPVEYLIGQKVYPTVGQLFAFDNYDKAYSFVVAASRYINGIFYIYQCEVEPTKKIKLFKFFSWNEVFNSPVCNFFLFINKLRKNHKKVSDKSDKTAPDVIFCDSIKLINKPLYSNNFLG